MPFLALPPYVYVCRAKNDTIVLFISEYSNHKRGQKREEAMEEERKEGREKGREGKE